MRKAIALIAAVSATSLGAAPPLRGPPPDLAMIATISGECRKLVVADTDHSKICAGVTANAIYDTGRSSFQFAAGKVVAIGFYGTDHAAVGDESYLDVEKISLNEMKGRPSIAIPASGKCTYTNPYAGPSMVQCSAVSAGKTYSASFVSNGQEPSITKF